VVKNVSNILSDKATATYVYNQIFGCLIYF